MNNFEQTFFKKYVPEGQHIKGVIHEHWVKILNNLLVRIGLFTIIPSFLYYYSYAIQDAVPFMYFEIFLILVYAKLIYDIFNWYNDVWIITEKGVIDVDWALLKTSSVSIKYENIEGIGVEQSGIWDKVLNKGDIVINKIGDDEFRLVDAKIPYEALDEIETMSQALKNEENNDHQTDRFDVIMETLGGVVEDYLEKKGLPEKQYQDVSDGYSQAENLILEEGTIDLRK